MVRLPAVRALGLGVALGAAGALLTTGAAGQAGSVGAAPADSLGPVAVPDDRATDPMPRLRARGLPPVPLPHVRRTGPGPVPMPEARAGERDDVLPLEVISPETISPETISPGRSGAAPRPGR